MTRSAPSHLRVAISPVEPPAPGSPPSIVGVIDVLRATTSIPHALAAGVARVVPLATAEEARHLAARYGGKNALLCGEREGIRLPGFQLGNSPSEYTRDRVEGHTLFYCSTNGSGAVVRWEGHGELLLLSFVNVGAAVERLAGTRGDIQLVCAGQGGRACLEDTALAGLAVRRLRERRPDLHPDDGAGMAERVWDSWRGNVEGMLRASAHGRYLEGLGFGSDLALCAERDVMTVVPTLAEGSFEGEGSPKA